MFLHFRVTRSLADRGRIIIPQNIWISIFNAHSRRLIPVSGQAACTKQARFADDSCQSGSMVRGSLAVSNRVMGSGHNIVPDVLCDELRALPASTPWYEAPREEPIMACIGDAEWLAVCPSMW